jgi:hypothetical protein
MYEKVITQLFNFEKVSKFGVKREYEADEKKPVQNLNLFQPSAVSEGNLPSEKSELTTKPMLKKQYTVFHRDNFLNKGEAIQGETQINNVNEKMK